MHIYLSREIFHAHKWHSEFQCPMINTVVGHVFQNDFITFQHDSCYWESNAVLSESIYYVHLSHA